MYDSEYIKLVETMTDTLVKEQEESWKLVEPTYQKRMDAFGVFYSPEGRSAIMKIFKLVWTDGYNAGSNNISARLLNTLGIDDPCSIK